MSDLAIEEQQKIKDAEACGLSFWDKEDGEMLFAGTDKAWNKYKELTNL